MNTSSRGASSNRDTSPTLRTSVDLQANHPALSRDRQGFSLRHLGLRMPRLPPSPRLPLPLRDSRQAPSSVQPPSTKKPFLPPYSPYCLLVNSLISPSSFASRNIFTHGDYHPESHRRLQSPVLLSFPCCQLPHLLFKLRHPSLPWEATSSAQSRTSGRSFRHDSRRSSFPQRLNYGRLTSSRVSRRHPRPLRSARPETAITLFPSSLPSFLVICRPELMALSGALLSGLI